MRARWAASCQAIDAGIFDESVGLDRDAADRLLEAEAANKPIVDGLGNGVGDSGMVDLLLVDWLVDDLLVNWLIDDLAIVTWTGNASTAAAARNAAVGKALK